MAKATRNTAVRRRQAPSRTKPAGKRVERGSERATKPAREARRQAVLTAALAVFAEHGFEAARLDDVAARAGVAKGTLYLYFADKEALLEELIRSVVGPVRKAIERVAANPALPAATALQTVFKVFESEVLGTERKLLVRLVISEGPRFPRIAELYFREVVEPGLALVRGLLERASRDGTLASPAVARHPQLVVAPLVVAVIWDSMFSRFAPLDTGAMLRAHAQLLAPKVARGSS